MRITFHKFMKVKVASSCPTLWPHRLYSPWHFLGQNTGMGGHAFLQGIFPTQGSNPALLHCRQTLYRLSYLYLVVISITCVHAQLCLTFCEPMNCSPPGSSLHRIHQARILEWVAICYSRGSSQPRDWTLHLLHWQADSPLCYWEAKHYVGFLK